MRKYIIICLTIMLTFLFPINVWAVNTEILISDPTTETITNYYYFEQAYNQNYHENQQITYGIFNPRGLGSTEGEITPVELKKVCSLQSKNCYTYENFWRNYKDITTSNQAMRIKEISDGNKKYNCNITYKEIKKNEYHYIHGCYREDWSSIIEDNSQLFKADYNPIGMACSSVSRESHITVSKDSVFDYLELKIVRDELKFSDVTTNNPLNLNSNISSCPTNNKNEVWAYTSEYSTSPYRSPILAKYTYQVQTNDCPNYNAEKSSSCNNSTYISQHCNKKTIIGSIDSRSDINFTQTGVLANVLSPTTIYQSGGVSIGFIYQNTLEWDYVDGTFEYRNMSSTEATNEIKTKIENLVKPLDVFKDELKNNFNLVINNMSNTSYLNEIKNNIEVACNRSGNIRDGKITTICKLSLPNTVLEIGTGAIEKVVESGSDTGANKFYTELTYSGKYHLTASFSGLNVLKSNEKSGDWKITIGGNINDTSCDINLTSRLYGENKFIYRPIDINNPFPNNRNAGVNWYEWWEESSNKERLSSSYNDNSLQYQINLNPNSIQKIKGNTTIKDYYDWDENDLNNNNSFIKEFFDESIQNNIEEGDY